MPNGKPGDHPLTDVLIHHRDLYGAEAESLIRNLHQLAGPQALHAWWNAELGLEPDARDVLEKCRARYEELRRQAERDGWEPD